MICETKQEILNELKSLNIENEISIKDETGLSKDIDLLVKNIVLSDLPQIKNTCFWVIWEIARLKGVFPASVHSFYKARGKGQIKGFTVPAINLRAFPYESARAIFKVAKKYKSKAFVFEIAESEIGYTHQKPAEYTAIVLAAAVKEGFQGPVFIQGDHFQVQADRYNQDPQAEIKKLKKLVLNAIEAGFYNIDIDSSTLVDLTKKNVIEQQRLNFEICGELTKFIRENEPEGIQISIGGEIGEVGKKNSTPNELRTFMTGYLDYLSPSGYQGISKISVQTGTFHGGVVLPDGTLAQVKIDFDTLRALSEISRREFWMAGSVQHGASTLPPEAFHKFPEVETAEVHLATQFQNIVYDNLPLSLKEKMYDFIRKHMTDQKHPKDTSEQFIYKIRKKALGPFRKELFSLTKDVKDRIKEKLQKEFDFLFQQLKVADTEEMVDKYVKPVEIKKAYKELIK